MGDSKKKGVVGFRSLVRRKRVDSNANANANANANDEQQLDKVLTVPDLIAIGVGSTIGAGIYVLVGTVAREHSGPALALSFLIAGFAAGLSAFCYAELSSRCPSAGSAYHYSYICLGESVAWLVGWGLILDCTVSGAAVARGISPNLEMLFGSGMSLPFFLARHHVPGIDITVDPCAAVLVFVVTGLLCFGIKESTLAQGIVTTANIFAMIFVIIAGGYIGFKSGWPGYQLSSGFFPFGVDGMLAGSATVFFAYIGFESVATTAEEVKNPRRDLPLGLAASLSVCCVLYMMVSIVVVGLVPYYTMDPDTPISSAFASHGIQWAAYIVAVGAITALCSTLFGSILPQPRILMAMARDGLLPSFFSDVSKKTKVPVKGTVVTGIASALLAFCMDVSQLARMVSVGTLLAFTMVAISVLVVRYVPPEEVPLPSSYQESIDAVSLKYNASPEDLDGHHEDVNEPLLEKVGFPSLWKQVVEGTNELSNYKRRNIAGWSIMLTCVGVLLLTSAASFVLLPRMLRYTVCAMSVGLLLSCLTVLTCIDQDAARHNFGHSGGFICPWVPVLPMICILINVYLLINLGAQTWMCVSVWLLMGVLFYIFYGRKHSSLRDALYVPTTHVVEICSISHDLA